jgi:hypothetical protein
MTIYFFWLLAITGATCLAGHINSNTSTGKYERRLHKELYKKDLKK